MRGFKKRRLLFTSRAKSIIIKPGGETKQAAVDQPQMKGRTIMGDKSPKSVQKHSSQKQAKADQFKKAKQQAVFAKQPISKKK